MITKQQVWEVFKKNVNNPNGYMEWLQSLGNDDFLEACKILNEV